MQNPQLEIDKYELEPANESIEVILARLDDARHGQRSPAGDHSDYADPSGDYLGAKWALTNFLDNYAFKLWLALMDDKHGRNRVRPWDIPMGTATKWGATITAEAYQHYTHRADFFVATEPNRSIFQWRFVGNRYPAGVHMPLVLQRVLRYFNMCSD